MNSKEISFLIESEAWVKQKNSYLNIPSNLKHFFPDDCFIARGTAEENKALLMERGIDIQYEGDGEASKCFMELRDSGKFRPSFRGNIRRFYEKNGAAAGDTVEIRKTGERTYFAALVKQKT